MTQKKDRRPQSNKQHFSELKNRALPREFVSQPIKDLRNILIAAFNEKLRETTVAFGADPDRLSKEVNLITNGATYHMRGGVKGVVDSESFKAMVASLVDCKFAARINEDHWVIEAIGPRHMRAYQVWTTLGEIAKSNPDILGGLEWFKVGNQLVLRSAQLSPIISNRVTFYVQMLEDGRAEMEAWVPGKALEAIPFEGYNNIVVELQPVADADVVIMQNFSTPLEEFNTVGAFYRSFMNEARRRVELAACKEATAAAQVSSDTSQVPAESTAAAPENAGEEVKQS